MINLKKIILESIPDSEPPLSSRIPKDLEDMAAWNIAFNWVKGGETTLVRDPSLRYIRLSDDMDHQLSIQYEEGGALEKYKYNRSANKRIAIKAKEHALSFLRGKRYPLLAAQFNIKPLEF